jgi:hypothetical protein
MCVRSVSECEVSECIVKRGEIERQEKRKTRKKYPIRIVSSGIMISFFCNDMIRMVYHVHFFSFAPLKYVILL